MHVNMFNLSLLNKKSAGEVFVGMPENGNGAHKIF